MHFGAACRINRWHVIARRWFVGDCDESRAPSSSIYIESSLGIWNEEQLSAYSFVSYIGGPCNSSSSTQLDVSFIIYIPLLRLISLYIWAVCAWWCLHSLVARWTINYFFILFCFEFVLSQCCIIKFNLTFLVNIVKIPVDWVFRLKFLVNRWLIYWL